MPLIITFPPTGDYIVAKYSGDSNYNAATNFSPAISIAPAPVIATLMPLKANFNRKKQLLSVGLTVKIQSTAPGTSVLPMGVVDFDLAPKGRGPRPRKVLASGTLQGGTATVRLTAKQIQNKSIEIYYAAVGFQGIDATLPAFTAKTLKKLERTTLVFKSV